MEQTPSSSQVSSSLPSQGKKIPFNIKARSEVLALILAGLLVVAGGVYYFMRVADKTPNTIIITKEEQAAFLKQIAGNPNPKISEKEEKMFLSEVAKNPNPQISEADIAAFMKQVQSAPHVIVQQ